MKKIYIFFLFAISLTSNAQTKDTLTTPAKFNASCLMTSGTITVSDYEKINNLCPPKLTKVIRFKFLYIPKGTNRKKAYSIYIESIGEKFDLSYKKVKPGDQVIYEDIVGLNADKKRSAAEAIVLTIK